MHISHAHLTKQKLLSEEEVLPARALQRVSPGVRMQVRIMISPVMQGTAFLHHHAVAHRDLKVWLLHVQQGGLTCGCCLCARAVDSLRVAMRKGRGRHGCTLLHAPIM